MRFSTVRSARMAALPTSTSQPSRNGSKVLVRIIYPQSSCNCKNPKVATMWVYGRPHLWAYEEAQGGFIAAVISPKNF